MQALECCRVWERAKSLIGRAAAMGTSLKVGYIYTRETRSAPSYLSQQSPQWIELLNQYVGYTCGQPGVCELHRLRHWRWGIYSRCTGRYLRNVSCVLVTMSSLPSCKAHARTVMACGAAGKAKGSCPRPESSKASRLSRQTVWQRPVSHLELVTCKHWRPGSPQYPPRVSPPSFAKAPPGLLPCLALPQSLHVCCQNLGRASRSLSQPLAAFVALHSSQQLEPFLLLVSFARPCERHHRLQPGAPSKPA